jgi:hypothetical protein
MPISLKKNFAVGKKNSFAGAAAGKTPRAG